MNNIITVTRVKTVIRGRRTLTNKERSDRSRTPHYRENQSHDDKKVNSKCIAAAPNMNDSDVVSK